MAPPSRGRPVGHGVAAIKSEPGVDEEVASMDIDDEMQNDEGGAVVEEDDEVVRTIDVYISPALSSTLHLVQFPLEPATATKATAVQLPAAARFRPIHRMLELDYAVPTNDGNDASRSVPDALRLDHRTHVSRAVDQATHAALAKLDQTGTKLDLIPLRRPVLQMRPGFGHIDDALRDDDGDDLAAASSAAGAESNAKQQPVLFKRKESDRAALARRSSYAYKRATEESERWTDLDVLGPGTVERRDALRDAVPCTNRDASLRFVGGSGVADMKTKAVDRSGGRRYVRTLNYLPGADLTEGTMDDFYVPPVESTGTGDKATEGRVLAGGSNDAETIKDLAARLASLLRRNGGMPIPYAVVRSRFPPESISDEVLVAALSSCAVLVRGNFVLKSSLLRLSSPDVVDARDLVLLLLDRHGIVMRERLLRMFCEGDDNGDVDEEGIKDVHPETIDAILGSIARKGENCWEPRVDDDPTFGVRFAREASFHAAYWERRMVALEALVHRYEDMEGEEEHREADDGMR